MSTLQILFVDDKDDQYQRLQDALNDWHATQAARRIEIVRATSVTQADKFIATHHLDAALIDLKIPMSPGDKELASGGNKLARSSLFEVGMPVGIISGYPKD